MKSKLILASSSPRRIEMLNKLGIEFDVIYPDVDETLRNGESPEELVLRLSKEKAENVSSEIDDKAVILAADTVVVLGDAILGKPGSEDEAGQMLGMLSGKTHMVTTGFTLMDESCAELHSEAVFTEVKFKRLAAEEIDGYIKTGEPIDKAGAYAIQGKGSFMVEEINGSFTNVVGLPLSRVVDVLSQKGLLKLFSKDGN